LPGLLTGVPDSLGAETGETPGREGATSSIGTTWMGFALTVGIFRSIKGFPHAVMRRPVDQITTTRKAR